MHNVKPVASSIWRYRDEENNMDSTTNILSDCMLGWFLLMSFQERKKENLTQIKTPHIYSLIHKEQLTDYAKRERKQRNLNKMQWVLELDDLSLDVEIVHYLDKKCTYNHTNPRYLFKLEGKRERTHHTLPLILSPKRFNTSCFSPNTIPQ